MDPRNLATDLAGGASHVVLSLRLGFAVFPLVAFTGSKRIMGAFANSRLLQANACFLAVAILLLNAYLVCDTVFSWRKG